MWKFFPCLMIGTALLMCSCKYEVESELYPKDPAQTCDTLLVGYQARIEPILKKNCTTCHSGSGAAGNVALENYAQVKQAAISRNLYASVAQTSDKPMPQGADKLPDCDIRAIGKWIENGFPQ